MEQALSEDKVKYIPSSKKSYRIRVLTHTSLLLLCCLEYWVWEVKSSFDIQQYNSISLSYGPPYLVDNQCGVINKYTVEGFMSFCALEGWISHTKLKTLWRHCQNLVNKYCCSRRMYENSSALKVLNFGTS